MRPLMHSAANGCFEPIYLYCCFAAKVCFCSEGCQSPSPVQSRRRGFFSKYSCGNLIIFWHFKLRCSEPAKTDHYSSGAEAQ
jgi:hypothetical protein